MNRRLFFLLPDIEHARKIVTELQNNSIAKNNTYIIARDDIDLKDLPTANTYQRNDVSAILEDIIWKGNLYLFFVAVLIAVTLVISNYPMWALLSLFIMLCCFAVGNWFTVSVPTCHSSEFSTAIQHGEILLVADIEKDNVLSVEKSVHRFHPEIIDGGVGWSLKHIPI